MKPKTLQFILAFSVVVLTTGFLRLQLIFGLPNTDDGWYTFLCQRIWEGIFSGSENRLLNGQLELYPFMTSWVFGLEVNQFILLRLIDGLVAITASIIFFKVILKESGSTLFTVILMATLLVLMNDSGNIAYGFKNSIWAAYLPLFTALLVWQKSSKADTFSFYVIGALVSLGVLLREPFLPFFLLAGFAILIGYGWRALVKYLIGSAILGFSVLAVVLSLRGWDLLDLINSYVGGPIQSAVHWWIWDIEANAKRVLEMAVDTIKTSWFICITALASIIYLIRLYITDKKSVRMNRFYFWLAVALLPLLEWVFKFGLPYHLANCLPGLAGLSAMGWKYINSNESKQVTTSSMIVIGLMSLIVIVSTVNRTIIKSDNILSPSDAIERIGMLDLFRGQHNIEKSQYLIAARKIYELSREDSTLAVAGFWQALYPLTNLLPPALEFASLRSLFLNLSSSEDKLINTLKEYRPTLILTSPPSLMAGEADFSSIVEKTNLYNKVGEVPKNLETAHGFLSGSIYRLKDFK